MGEKEKNTGPSPKNTEKPKKGGWKLELGLKTRFESIFVNTKAKALWDITRSFWDIKNFLSHKRGSERSERASEQVSAASEASSLEQANE